MSDQLPKKENKMSDEPKRESLKRIRQRLMSPAKNPFLEQPFTIKTKNRNRVIASTAQPLLNTTTGQIEAVQAIQSIQHLDDKQFVKVFAEGVQAAYDLGRTASRVFQLVLHQYQNTPMHNGYADSIDLYWFGDGIEGKDIGMSERSFKRGLRELLDNQFLHPKTPTSFWINPALFFKGDRYLFITDYRRKTRTEKDITPGTEPLRDPNTIDLLTNKTDAES